MLSRFSKKVWELPQFPHCDGSLELVTFFAFSDTVTIKMWESIEWPNIAKNNTGSKELMKTLKQCMELTNHRNLFITFLDCSNLTKKSVCIYYQKYKFYYVPTKTLLLWLIQKEMLITIMVTEGQGHPNDLHTISRDLVTLT